MTDTGNPEQWYYASGSDRKGPFSLEQMKALVEVNSIGPQTFVWAAGMPDWLPLEQTALFRKTTGSSADVPPLPPAFSGTPFFPSQAVGFFEAVSSCFRKYVDFHGRAVRSEYWYFWLFGFIGAVITVLFDIAIFSAHSQIHPLTTIFELSLFLPSLAVGARRLHDTDRSAWWLLFSLVPLVGIITLTVFFCERGTRSRNRFG